MLTPGFRLFFGFSIFGLIAAFVYAVASGGDGTIDYLGFIDAEAWVGAVSLGWKGSVGDHVGYIVLLSFSAVSAGIAFLLVAFRDADAKSVAELAGGVLPPAQGQTVNNFWPAVGAFGAGLLIVGLVTHAAIFVCGIIVLVATMFEWTAAAWADRATGDPVANKELRDRLVGPIELPLIGILGIGALVLAISRVLLAVSVEWAVWIATILSGVIFLTAVVLALSDKPKKNLVAGIVTLAAVGVLVGGVVAASVGEREFHDLEHEGEQSEHSEEDALG